MWLEHMILNDFIIIVMDQALKKMSPSQEQKIIKKILTYGRSKSTLSFEKLHFKPGDGLGLTCNSNPFGHLKSIIISIVH